ncbi:DinB family protein [Acidipila sp. EB88]|uniref:DinB family protein n=1 Tax=Acidipila sp. EB88 TaxID=2305226 RepID=UPI000F5FE3C6|nr:DinB family protein [Acidipila sp. EB88]RRA49760.1 DUF664 domain-containing protein [Acidipila sp. EB88]
MQEQQVTMLREQLVEAIEGGAAHQDIAAVFGKVRDQDWGAKAAGSPHTLWQLLEHMRFTLRDLFVFSTDEAYVAPEWPRDYWPPEEAPENAAAAKRAFAALEQAVEEMTTLISNPETDLFAEIAWGEGQTILREALLAAEHNSYHLGQAMLLRRQLEG